MAEIICTNCGTKYPDELFIHLCAKCGGVFDFNKPPRIVLSELDASLPGIWKYRTSFRGLEGSPVVSLGEGNTPFVWEDANTREIGFKFESLNPTGSYKDRGTALILSRLAGLGITEAVEDSSGNAGASFSAYCARAGIKARVYVPESASGPKRRQIEQYGAQLILVPGPRSEAARAVLEAIETGQAYASHAYLPFGLPGIATIAYELLEKAGRSIGTVITPAGHGALLLGIMRGFAALQNAGEILNQPYYVGVQAEPCSPMALAFREGLENMANSLEGVTLAEGVRVARPVRAKAILNEFGSNGGEMVSVPESELLPAMYDLAAKGIYCEPTSALVWAAFKKNMHRLSYPIILIISGNGLKYYPD